MQNCVHPDLLADILAFCEASGIPKSQFGIDAMSDPRFVFDLENGRECRRATIARARDFMAAKQAAQ